MKAYGQKGIKMSIFKKASKKQQKLRLLLEGASGSGKTYSALILAQTLGKKIAVIDTEKGSASLYDKLVDFDVCELNPPFTPEMYINAITEAEKQGYDVLIIDSITHEWSGKGGCLDIQSGLGGRYQDWAKVTPRHNAFIDKLLSANMHIIATARAKSDYETTNVNGKMKVEKVGLKTEQRDGLDFEFTLVFRLNENHIASATKDRTSLFFNKEGIIDSTTGEELLNWLNSGEEVNIDNDFDIFSEIPNCESIDALNTYYKFNVNAVQDKDKFIELCGQQKEKLQKKTIDKAE